MSEVLVTAENVSKKFCRGLRRSLWYGLQDIGAEMLGRQRPCQLREDEFWAVKNVSFELRRGECLGLIGPNGSGKSTLLKLLNGLIKPDSGRITMRGRVGAMIELGTGFNPILTGMENIYNNAAVLGFSKAETDKRVKSILEFAEIGDYIHMPIKNYSSGMKVRLGFSVAAQLEPDILLIDEVLAVGDVGFRAKCYDLLNHRLRNSAVILVSHSMSAINRNCNSVIAMKGGFGQHFKDPGEGIQYYYDLCSKGRPVTPLEFSSSQAKIENVQVRNREDKSGEIWFKGSFEVSFELSLSPEIDEAIVYLNILSREKTLVAFTTNETQPIKNSGAKQRVHFHSPQLTLSPGDYSLAITLYTGDGRTQLLWYHGIAPFQVKGKSHFRAPVTLIGNWEIINGAHYSERLNVKGASTCSPGN